MPKISQINFGRVSFYCPGCKEIHNVKVVKDDVGYSWEWNESYDSPTFQPSILVKVGHYVSGQEGKDCWCTFEERVGKPSPFKCLQCHSFVKDGKIQFLLDCTHELAGQTVELPEYKS